MADLIGRLRRIVVPGLTMVQHPMHYGWFPSNAALASVLGDLASSGMGALGLSWESCPALTEVEEVVCDWMRQLVGFSEAWSGVISDTASTSTLTALMVARERITDLGQNHGGMQRVASPLVVYTSSQAHSSVAKAALLAGFGWDNLRTVATDPSTHAMDPVALRAAMVNDVGAGRIPAAVVANTGSTGVTAMDPIDRIVEVADEHGAWVHVDAAMAGSAMLLPECRHLWNGVEGADSVSWNPHKWMGTVLDCSLLYFRDVDLLQRVMSTNPSYLQSPADGAVTQYRDWGIPLGRRFRAMKLSVPPAPDGMEAIRARLRRDLEQRGVAGGPGRGRRRILARDGPAHVADGLCPAFAARNGRGRGRHPHARLGSSDQRFGVGLLVTGDAGRALDGEGVDWCRSDRAASCSADVGPDASSGRLTIDSLGFSPQVDHDIDRSSEVSTTGSASALARRY